MRLARAFSTLLRLSKQALYEPYIAPLNQEQKKALRKVISADMPHLHSRFNKDIQWLLTTYSPSQSTCRRRLRTLETVKKIVQSAFGPEYSVVDRSLSQYSRDVEYAPLELAITDESRPTGFPPDQVGPQFPDAYSHEAIAKVLQQHGYHGHFVAGDAMRNQPEGSPNMIPQTSRGPYPITFPWPTYTPFPTIYLTYPPILFAERESDDLETVPFFLSPPVPTHDPLLKLLKAYTSQGTHIGDMITFIFLWTRSIDLPELTPTCIALMVIGWLQSQKHLSSLQNPENKGAIEELAKKDDGVWFPSSLPSPNPSDNLYTSTWLETGFLEPRVDNWPKNVSTLLHSFFSFWGLRGDESAFISSAKYISVREGMVMPRQHVMVAKPHTLRKDERQTYGGIPPSLTHEPIIWQTQPIVIQDPFVPSYNHAQALSRAAGSYFHYYCSLSQRTVFHGHPMTTILGPSLPKPRSIPSMKSRKYSTAPIAQDILDMYESNRPPEPIFQSRRTTISRVQNAIHKRFGAEYRIESFGSTRYGVSSPTSDLDLVVIDQNNGKGFARRVPNKRLPEIYNISAIATTLKKNGFVIVDKIPNANVPIVKFRDPQTGLDCDLNVNEQLGLWNTRLVAQYCDLAPDLLRPLIVVIKRWAKSHGLNEPSPSIGRPCTFSSYSLALMTIGYLQLEGVLPTLQAGLSALPDNPKNGIFWLRSKGGPSVMCDIRFNSGHDWTPQVQLSVEEAFVGWFRFWGETFLCEEHVLSIREGKLCYRQKKNKQKTAEKIHATDNMPSLEIQALARDAEEDAVLTAFAEQNDFEDSAGSDGIEQEENIHIKPEVVLSNSEAEQPPRWQDNILVIADPFIISKNVCGNIGKAAMQRFRAECRSCVEMLELGSDLGSLMGEESLSPRTKAGRGGRGMRGRGGRVEAGSRGRAKEKNKGKGRKSDTQKPQGNARIPETAGAGPSRFAEMTQ